MVLLKKRAAFERRNVRQTEKQSFICPLANNYTHRESDDIGQYGQLWVQYIQTEYPKRYASLLSFNELQSKAREVNEVADELYEDIIQEWMESHKPKKAISFTEMYQLRMEAKMIANEVVMHDVVNCFH